MIIFVTDKVIRKNFKSWGFKKIDDDIIELINQALYAYVKKILEKTLKKKKDGIIDRALVGGRILMPAEYYGVETDHYTVDATPGTDMNITDSLIRPAFTANMAGGAGVFTIPLGNVKNVVADIISGMHRDIQIKQKAVADIQRSFETKFSDVMKSLKRKVKGEEVTRSDVVAVLKMKKFIVMF